MKTKAEIGVMLPQITEYRGLLKAGRVGKNPSLEALEGTWSCKHTDFRLIATTTKN